MEPLKSTGRFKLPRSMGLIMGSKKSAGKRGGYLFLLPLILFFVLMAYPLARIFYLSVFEATFLNPSNKEYVGSANFRWLFTFIFPGYEGIYFLNCLKRSMMWIAGSVSLKLLLGLGGALVLNQEFRGRSVYRALTIVPWAIPWAIGGMMWNWTFNTEFGIINGLLTRTGLIGTPIGFLGDEIPAFISCVVTDVWMGLPFMVFVFLAGLQAIPRDLYDASQVDGASGTQQFIHITIPQLKPVMVTAILLSTLWTFNSFDNILVLTGGGPLQATETLPIAIYNTAFRRIRFGGLGNASAMTAVQVAIVSILVLFYLWLSRRSK